MPTSGSLGSFSPTDPRHLDRRRFRLGANQTDGLRWEGLKVGQLLVADAISVESLPSCLRTAAYHTQPTADNHAATPLICESVP